jgi:hypothetical protein
MVCRSLLVLLALTGLAWAADKSSCASDPFDVKIPHIQVQNTAAIQTLVAVSQAARVCIGIEGADELRYPVSMDSTGLTYSRFLHLIAPKMRFRMDGNVVDIESSTSGGATWLDTEMLLQTDTPTDVNWIAYWILGTQIYYRSRPGMKGGIVGSIGEVGVQVGPYPKELRPLRRLLNQVVRDAGGGCWLTPKRLLKRDGPSPIHPWLILLYRTDPKLNQRSLRVFAH